MPADRTAPSPDGLTHAGAALDEPIVLPTPAPPARRPPLPVVAAVVPIAAAVVMWLVTGSIFMLLFAALGPLIAGATAVDAARAARRDRRRAVADARKALGRAEAELAERHECERTAGWAVAPDAGALLQRERDVWRPATARGDVLVVGTGQGRSEVRVLGGGDDAQELALRRRAGVVEGMPVSVPARAGVCVVGPRASAAAVARALALQLCLVHPPERLSIVQAPAGEEWAAAVPHARTRAAVRLALLAPGDVLGVDAEIVVAAVVPGAPMPAQCGVALTLEAPDTARLEHGPERRELTVEAVSHGQASAAAQVLAAAAAAAEPEVPALVPLAALLESADRSRADATALDVPIGAGRSGPTVVDLVADGPHAVVAGVTGSGKSELLATWVAALCATRTPAQVCFLLADFKGGTAFDRLADLPHVTGVITDLDAAGARRAVQSLRAELRRREAALAAAGARDIGDAGVGMPRLVVMVDEFAAVLAEHPELQSVFSDVAARGRALGMHLVLGTQRVAGVVRDALLANCPLRISLRVTDAADSRAVIGTDDAARLPGDAVARGLALVRRAGDTSPIPTRVALTGVEDIDRIAAQSAAHDRPHRPWLPALPHRVTLDALVAARAERPTSGDVVLGLADEPDRQRQPLVRLRQGVDRGIAVLGGARTGKSTLLGLAAEQAAPGSLVRVPTTPEAAWDAVAAMVACPPDRALVVADDLDALAAMFPPEYAAEFLDRFARIVRVAGAHDTTVLIAAQRAHGGVARILDLLPRRVLLAMRSRLDHVSAGGDPADFEPDAPPGRGVLDGARVQFALPSGPAAVRLEPAEVPPWRPGHGATAVAVRAAGAETRRLAASLPERRVVLLDGLGAPGRAEDHAHDDAVVVGDPESWQRHWALWSRRRSGGAVVVSAGCLAEYRALTGLRELPPYAEGADRAWLVAESGDVSRVRLPRGEEG